MKPLDVILFRKTTIHRLLDASRKTLKSLCVEGLHPYTPSSTNALVNVDAFVHEDIEILDSDFYLVDVDYSDFGFGFSVQEKRATATRTFRLDVHLLWVRPELLLAGVR